VRGDENHVVLLTSGACDCVHSEDAYKPPVISEIDAKQAAALVGRRARDAASWNCREMVDHLLNDVAQVLAGRRRIVSVNARDEVWALADIDLDPSLHSTRRWQSSIGFISARPRWPLFPASGGT
jgi:hypothetical protein